MKKLLLVAALLVSMPATVSANDDCDKIAQMAQIVMQARQGGASKEEAMSLSYELTNPHRTLVQGLVHWAYTQEVQRVNHKATMAIVDFKRAAYEKCKEENNTNK